MSKQHPENLQATMQSLYEGGESATEIAKSMGLHTTSVMRVLKRRGVEIQDTRSGENHPMWKGGEVVKNGYPAEYAPNHPRRLNVPYVHKHVLEMEKAIGRVPRSDEPIHHIDLDRANYHIDNLYLCQSNSQHQKLHGQLNRVVSELIKDGTIVFIDGKYQIGKRIMDIENK